MKIENLQLCTGCGSCYSVCPVAAITMQSDNEGFLYPVINKHTCIECGKCESVCPILHPVIKEKEETIAYAVINKNEEIRLDSSSGGVFTAIAEKIIKQDGIVFGAKFNTDFEIEHGWTDTITGLADFRGSKYVQSNIGESYKECKIFLDKGNKVLFSGTPCQVAGLKTYLAKDYENLLLVDIICHGVPSPLLWQKYKDMTEKKFASRIEKIAFRRKNEGWKLYSLAFTFSNASEYSKTLKEDSYLKLFLKDVCLRESCYHCKYKTVKRISDLTIADFWGVQHEYPDLDDDKGTSFVISHSEKANFIITSLENCIIENVSLESGVRHNSAYYKSCVRPKKRDSFFIDLERMKLEKLVKKYTKVGFLKRSYRFIRRFGSKLKRKLVGKIK